MSLVVIPVNSWALGQLGPAQIGSQKKSPIFEDLLTIFQGALSGEVSLGSFNFVKKFSGGSTEAKIQELAAPAEVGQQPVMKQNAVSSMEVSAGKSPPAPPASGGDLAKARLLETIYALFGQSPPAGLVIQPAVSNFGPISLADEINFLVEEIISRIKVAAGNSSARMDLFLKRDFLGSLKISLTFENNKLKIEIFSSPEVRPLLEAHFSQLVEKLKEAGIEVGCLNVSVEQNYQNNGNQKEAGEDFEIGLKTASGSAEKKSGGAGENFLKFAGVVFWVPDRDKCSVHTII
jgi:flagellar hook-length control protein FliK